MVSGDDNGFISVWDIENGKLMSKFQTQTNVNPKLTEQYNPKLTTGTFDMWGRRLITSGADGQVRIWNFSNGQSLKDCLSADAKPKVDTEITALISIYDSNVKLSNYLNEQPKVKNPCFLAVGWDKKLHIWDDPALKNDQGPEEEEKPFTCTDLPPITSKAVHHQDIMSCTFDLKHMLIFTGGVDGHIIGWNYETKFARYYSHTWDPTCTSGNFTANSKSVDALVIMKKERLLLSMSADQYLRFWDIEDL